MMSSREEEPERIAEILREILALSGRKRANDPESTGADDSNYSTRSPEVGFKRLGAEAER